MAVVGDKHSQDYLWLRALATFRGKLYSVQINPGEARRIAKLGVPNFSSLADIPGPVDHVICSVPRRAVLTLLDECWRKNVTTVTLFTAGYAETSDPDAARAQQELGDWASSHDLVVIGPNCMGLYNRSVGIRQDIDQAVGPGDKVGFIAQSGTHCINFCLLGEINGVRCSKAVSFGNGEALKAADFLGYFADDPDISIIGIYLEGMPEATEMEGARFFRLIRATTPRKPVVVWKGGITPAGARAVFSHTASLAVLPAMWQGAMKQAGAISTETLEDSIDAVKALLYLRPTSGTRAALVSLSGGQSVAMSDAFEREGLEVPPLTNDSYKRLRGFFNVIGGTFLNPMDAGATTDSGVQSDGLEMILRILDADENTDVIVVAISVGFILRRLRAQPRLLDRTIEGIAAFKEASKKALMVIAPSWHTPALAAKLRAKLTARGIAAFDSYDGAARAFRGAVEYWRTNPQIIDSA